MELRSALAEAAEDFAILYHGWLRAAAASRTIRVEVTTSGGSFLGRRRFAVAGDGEELFRGLKPEEVLPYIEWEINYRLIATRPEYLQLHAATLAHGGNGVLLVGNSGCGKSTLTAALAARGWGYLCDEFALIDPDTLHLHGFPKALCIKAGSFDLLEQRGLPLWRRRPYVKVFKGRVGYISPHDVNVAEGDVPIRLIVFPRYTGGERTAAYPVLGSEAAFSLAANAFNRSAFGDRVVSMLGEIVRGARCLTLETGDIEETGDLLESLIAVPSA